MEDPLAEQFSNRVKLSSVAVLQRWLLLFLLITIKEPSITQLGLSASSRITVAKWRPTIAQNIEPIFDEVIVGTEKKTNTSFLTSSHSSCKQYIRYDLFMNRGRHGQTRFHGEGNSRDKRAFGPSNTNRSSSTDLADMYKQYRFDQNYG